jgi:hypothetical protein
MRYHIDVLGRLHGVWGLFGILTGSSLFVLALGCWASLDTLAPVSRAGDAAVWILVATGLTLVLAGAAMMAAGRGVRRHRQAGRALAIGLSLPNLVLVPFGTALGVYALWVLLNDDARRAFGRPPRMTSSVPTSMEEDL